MKKISLSKQLLLIIFSLFLIIILFIGIFLPKVLMPIYEKNIYNYLKQPLAFVGHDLETEILKDNVAYLYFKNDGYTVISENFDDVVSITAAEVLEKAKENSYGKFMIKGKLYYYYTLKVDDGMTLSITDDSYILQIRRDIWVAIMPILLFAYLFITLFIALWSRRLIKKIEYLKDKVDNIGNPSYKDKIKLPIDDEFKILSDAIDNMRISLQKQEDYKNQMYQNISHDFKTPLTVIKSYLEAYDDKIESDEEVHKVIKEEVLKLENKVHSLLYLNKLSYISEYEDYKNEKTDIAIILNNTIKKLKIQRPDIDYQVYLKGSTQFNGSENMWEAILENILNNFIRYAKTTIKVIIKNSQIILYNDGPNIRENILDDIFTPYKKGINGQFGLGLSIVKKTLILCGYEISVRNENHGISFIIKKKK